MSLPVPITDMLIEQESNRPRTKNNAKYLVVHWTANMKPGADAIANARYFQTTKAKSSAHYVVDDHKIIRCIPEDEVAYSVGAKKYTIWSEYNIGSYPNHRTISVEMCVDEGGKFWSTYSNTCHLCADILKRHKWPMDRLIRHYDVTGKICPAYFVGNLMAHKFVGKSAKDAWAAFRHDVDRLMKE